jgi:hypothetical protein
MENIEIHQRTYRLSWIFAVPLFIYAGWASVYLNTHFAIDLQRCREIGLGLPPLSIVLSQMGTFLATCITLALAILVPVVNVQIPHRVLNILATALIILLSVIFSSFVVLATYGPEVHLASFK